MLGVFEKTASLDLMQVIKKELKLVGSWTCSFSFPQAIDLVADRKVDLHSLITHRYALKDGARNAFDYGLMETARAEGSDARHYTAVGIPAVLYGAGPRTAAEANIGGADERLVLDDLRRATETVACALAGFLRVSG